MKKIRAVLSGIVALAAIGTFSVFAFRIPDSVSNAEIQKDTAQEQTDVTLPVMEAKVTMKSLPVTETEPVVTLAPVYESPEKPDEAVIQAVEGYVTAESRYEAVGDKADSLDYLNIVPLNEVKQEIEPVAVVTEAPVAEPESFLPETVAPIEEEIVLPPVDIDPEVTTVKEVVEKDELIFEEIPESVIDWQPPEVTTVYRPGDLSLYGQSSDGSYEAEYVVYNFDTPSLMPLQDDTVMALSDLPEEGIGEQFAPEGEEAPEIPEAPRRAGYLVPSGYNGAEVFTVNFGGETQEVDAYSIVCMICATEMSPSFSYEALKAQAVAAYSYVKYHNVNGLVPSVLVKYSVPETIKSAVDEVFGQCVYYNGRVAQTVYTASTAGTTASASNVWGGNFPYLESVETPIDSMYDPNWGIVVQYTKDEMKYFIESYCGITLSEDPENWIKIMSYHDGKYVSEIYLDDVMSISGRRFREGLMHYGLKSWAFDVYYDPIEEVFNFTTYGYGHGVGMSQNGANILGRQGYSYVDILAYYFPGTNVQ